MKKIRFEAVIDDSEIHTEAMNARIKKMKLKYKGEAVQTEEGFKIKIKPKCSK